MSKLLSLKLNDDIYIETENILSKTKIPRNAYINQAVEFFNKIQKRNLLKKKLHSESKLVSSHSLEILTEFEKLEADEIRSRSRHSDVHVNFERRLK